MQSKVNNQTLTQLISGRVKDISGDSFSEKNWNTLAHKAHAEGVGPLLYDKLSKSGFFLSLSEETRNFLRLIYAATSIQNHMIFKELEILTRLFHEVGIAVVALKGVSFALTIYPDIGLRPMGDIDLLVPKGKLVEAVEIAKSLDYQDLKPEASSG